MTCKLEIIVSLSKNRGDCTQSVYIPRATAPPCILTLSISRLSREALTRATTAKASLISWKSMSTKLSPACFNALRTANEIPLKEK